MGTLDIQIIIGVVVVLAALVVLRINAAMVFLSLCLGYVLVQFVANDADSFVMFISPNRDSLTASSIRLILLFAPAVLTSLITLGSMRGKARPVLNVLPALGATALLFLFLVPQLPSGLTHTIQQSMVWEYFVRAQAACIGGGAFVSMFMLWSQRPKHSNKHDGHGKH